jgi:hypothetical protein
VGFAGDVDRRRQPETGGALRRRLFHLSNCTRGGFSIHIDSSDRLSAESSRESITFGSRCCCKEILLGWVFFILVVIARNFVSAKIIEIPFRKQRFCVLYPRLDIPKAWRNCLILIRVPRRAFCKRVRTGESADSAFLYSHSSVNCWLLETALKVFNRSCCCFVQLQKRHIRKWGRRALPQTWAPFAQPHLCFSLCRWFHFCLRSWPEFIYNGTRGLTL